MTGKTICSFSIFLFLALSGSEQTYALSVDAGALRLQIEDGTGRITALTDIASDTNYIAPSQASYLMECKKYTGSMMPPSGMTMVENLSTHKTVTLSYAEGITLTIKIIPKTGYFHMELINAVPAAEIDRVAWGSYKTTMRGPVGDWIGLNRSADFTLGVLSLEPNTDGRRNNPPRPVPTVSAEFRSYGSSIQLYSYDHTRVRNHRTYAQSVPIPELTVIGSKAALFGVSRGRNSELNLIEQIELAEHLPHTMYMGHWDKRALELKLLNIITPIQQNNSDETFALAKQLGAKTVTRPQGFFKNWGQFEIDQNLYPDGLPALLEDSRKAQTNGIKLSLYTLADFIMPRSAAEPYLAPIPDDRLQTWTPETTLAHTINAGTTTLTAKKAEGLAAVFRKRFKVIRIGNEFIEFRSFTDNGSSITLNGCRRGGFYTTAAAHPKGSRIACMYLDGYRNFHPGTLEMSLEMADKIAAVALAANLDEVVLDSYEGCLETGHGIYALNTFVKTIYDQCGSTNDVIFTSNLLPGNYNWHMLSHQGWGEGRRKKGFRETELDARLQRQITFRRNLLPCCLGRYSPDALTTVEDVNQLMALATGWEAGIIFEKNIRILKYNNPNFDEIGETIRLWQEAGLAEAFTDAQKMELRQTDIIHTLTRDAKGTYNLKFKRFRRHKWLKILPPSAFPITPLSGGSESIEPLSIDWSWTHNPGIYYEACLSDDLIHYAGGPATTWKVTYPPAPNPTQSGSGSKLLCIVRLPEDAPCGVRNIKVNVDNRTLKIPHTLLPGQYASTTHEMQLTSIYDANHTVIAEVDIPQYNIAWYMPGITRGIQGTIAVTCDSVDPSEHPEVRVNLRYDNHITEGLTAPKAEITAPADTTTVSVGNSILFAGTGEDKEDGFLSGGKLVWTSSRDGQIGTGTSFSTDRLSEGIHTITLTVKDNDSPALTNIHTITLSVVSKSAGPRSML